MTSGIATNGFWGKNPTQAFEKVQALRDAGLGFLVLSYDRYHAAFQGPEPAINIAQAANEQRFTIIIGITRVADDSEVGEIAQSFESLRYVRLRFYDVQPVGRARGLESDSLRAEVTGCCDACNRPAITDDGRVTACNGPSYFAKTDSPLHVGSLHESSLAELLNRHAADPVLDTIRIFGPSRLREELQQIPGFEEFPFRAHYSGMCDLCHHITSNPEAVRVLQARLAEPKQRAQRVAQKQVLIGNKMGDRPLTYAYVNNAGACRVFLRATLKTEDRWTSDADKILGRADFDWKHQVTYLAQCGLLPLLLPAINDPQLKRWAPQFFIDAIRAAALAHGMKVLVQREALRRISSVLQHLDTQGILLKGAAFQALAVSANSRQECLPARATGDIDLYVAPSHALRLRQTLLEMGFNEPIGSPQKLSSRHHHLPPILFQGIVIEIHIRLAPEMSNLPEQEMIGRARPLADQDMEHLSTLDAEGLFLHTVMHVSHDLFRNGLKAAWDVSRVLDMNPDLDWSLLKRWVRSSGTPSGFWAALRVLCRELDITVPPDFLNGVRRDSRQHRLENYAMRHLFSALLPPLSTNTFSDMLLIPYLHDSRTTKLKYLSRTLSLAITARLSRARYFPIHSNAVPRPKLTLQLRQALGQWRTYR